MDINHEKAIDELIEVQLDSVEGFTMGDELRKNAMNDIEATVRTKAKLTEIEMMKRKDEREEKESNERIKQGWVTVAGKIVSGFVAAAIFFTMNVVRVIDEGNGNPKSRTEMNLSKACTDAILRMFR